jgi:hypothetical protein
VHRGDTKDDDDDNNNNNNKQAVSHPGVVASSVVLACVQT